ncbi:MULTISPECIES: TetR/AcrR family transcriptional regulator [unclassified Clostridioides]|uniref:TetR/AcrR family transcriptional regulator n=1 Tax=unclassified Clostridioides TaxID=2635829 RepID=UPI001D10B54A|nr:TetR/AcrR family transcriptional regulator [Clostridioides sp. ZZV14-6150]MCC0660631.1 TetR/AcrR family transcriptional regulator [Clostridioides sp. ZZV14-6154]MCC0669750.1 TetR/AcrR family transcriptional regulator [Clostridioides sp. ZZV14-6153]MCC0724187.1 TetR/AcrR family transcriptional regulator [Clostridioides sp. ZZV14-6104]MCC0727752.1 TetR/AcrR family transcriptional regulator [Clostridioides sp. ZZV14-6045]MCC0732393.1 TetR/AcrR family transcriptional regulator [Clostridioides s
MARKPVLEGGKREEILDAAIRLFLKYGYESTSVRMILNEVNGEVGMFYHYFSSKQELFDKSLEHFMKKQSENFAQLLIQNEDTLSFYEIINRILDYYEQSISQFHKLVDNKVHWTILYALHGITIKTMLPTIKSFIELVYLKTENDNVLDLDFLTQYTLNGISGLLHSERFPKLNKSEQHTIISEFLGRTLKVPPLIFTMNT